jgi:NTE family protein
VRGKSLFVKSTPPRSPSPWSLFLLLPLAVALGAGCRSAGPPAGAGDAASAVVTLPPRVGLALGGGGARGFAHIGVLRVLEQEKIPIDLVVGTSSGSLIGALYADRGRVLDAEYLGAEVRVEDFFDFGALSLFTGGLADGEGIESFLREHLKSTAIEQMAVPFAAVATELRTGRTVPFARGPVGAAVRASCAVPGVFRPVVINGETYVDGGVTDPVPADVARRLGAEVVIAVAVPAAVPDRTPSSTAGVVLQSVSLLAAEIQRLRAGEADVVIAPDAGTVAYDDFSQKKRLIEAGEAAARAALPAIRAVLEAHTREVPAAQLPN